MDSVIIFCAKYLFVFVIVGLIVAWIPKDKNTKICFIVATIIAGIIAFILAQIGSHLYYDPRPFVTRHITPLISHAADNGFPSDHALLTATLTAVTYFYNKKVASVMLVLTAAVCAARVLANVHSPIDMIGSGVFAAVGALASYYITRWLFNKYILKKNVKVSVPTEEKMD